MRVVQAFGKALKAATAEIEALKSEVAEGKLVPNFGAKADAICNTVRGSFACFGGGGGGILVGWGGSRCGWGLGDAHIHVTNQPTN